MGWIKDATNTLADLCDKIVKFDARTAPSITRFVNQVNVSATVYIEENIANDDIAIPLMGCLNQMYVCWVICALGLDDRCSDGRTVRDRMSIVRGLQSMTDDDLISDIMKNFGTNRKPQSAMEGVMDDIKKRYEESKHYPNHTGFAPDSQNKNQYANQEGGQTTVQKTEEVNQRLITSRLVEFDFMLGTATTTTVTKGGSRTEIINQNNITDNNDKTVIQGKDKRGNDITTTKTGNRKTDMSKRTEVTTHDPSTDVTTDPTKRASLKAYFHVTLFPYNVNTQIAADYLRMNTIATFRERWNKVRAGEISFWKDFVFSRDVIERERRTLKNDRSGLINRMMARQASGVFRFALGQIVESERSHNLANAILILDRQTVDRVCRDCNLNFDNRLQREQFFLKTFTMMLLVVDPSYGKATMYLAGVNNVGTYNFAMINKIGGNKNDNFDLKDIMTAMASSQAPRF